MLLLHGPTKCLMLLRCSLFILLERQMYFFRLELGTVVASRATVVVLPPASLCSACRGTVGAVAPQNRWCQGWARATMHGREVSVLRGFLAFKTLLLGMIGSVGRRRLTGWLFKESIYL